LAARAGEFSPVALRLEPMPRSNEILEHRIAEWSETQSPAIAGEVLGASMLSSIQPEKVIEVAMSVCSNSRATDATRSLALLILGREADEEQSLGNADPRIASRRRIHELRERLREDPRNAIAWANVALHYTKIAQIEKAVAAMKNAVFLAPDNRFILRSAARLHIHRGNPDVAHGVLLNSSATQQDPWLLAAEIATASSMNKSGFFIKDGRNAMKSGKYSEFHTAEIASALGTIELNSGSGKAAKRLFAQSLRKPTENVVAQARWAFREGNFDLDPVQLQTARSYEARAWHYYYEGDWGNALGEAINWLEDQSFSSRPAALGSYIASLGLGDFSKGAEIAKIGLLANPTDPTLTNNYIFCLANCGKLHEAEQVFAKIAVPQRFAEFEGSNRPSILATAGLLAYRRGDIERGRELYKKAITEAEAAHLPKHSAVAAIYFAMEELRAMSATATESYNLASIVSKGVFDKDVQLLLKHLDELRATTQYGEPGYAGGGRHA
jgi:Tfp pilus assembly protein PilF